MKRFLIGFVLGGSSSGITWTLTHNLDWTAVVGLVVVGLVWIGELIHDDLL